MKEVQQERLAGEVEQRTLKVHNPLHEGDAVFHDEMPANILPRGKDDRQELRLSLDAEVLQQKTILQGVQQVLIEQRKLLVGHVPRPALPKGACPYQAVPTRA